MDGDKRVCLILFSNSDIDELIHINASHFKADSLIEAFIGDRDEHDRSDGASASDRNGSPSY